MGLISQLFSRKAVSGANKYREKSRGAPLASSKEKIQITEEFKSAIDLINSEASPILVTGVAGTGKSTLLIHLRETLKRNYVVVAPTGMAAINVRGVTIHSFFKFPPKLMQEQDIKINYSKVDVFKKLEILVIDEVSMVRADLMDAIDVSLRLHRGDKRPFGGVQVVVFGDVCQLPPVVHQRDLKEYFSSVYKTPFFFSSHVFAKTGIHIQELTQVFRQKDAAFIRLLNKIRKAEASIDDLLTINELYEAPDEAEDKKDQIILCTTNKVADAINQKRLSELPLPGFRAIAEVTGTAKGKKFPADEELTLRKGAQIMMVKNNGLHWVNGSIGTVIDFEEEEITVKLSTGRQVVTREEWEVIEYKFNRTTRKLEEEVIGTFKQFPIRLAWAITIHKSQGQSFDQVAIDMGSGAFAHGQLYVALSRCRTLEGITMRTPVAFTDLCFDDRVSAFIEAAKNGGRIELRAG